MKLLPEADRVVRQHLPTVLEAVGQGPSARQLRGLNPLADQDSVVAACETLRAVRTFTVGQDIWRSVVEDAIFWCEAAIMAALREDVSSFRHHIDKATAAMRSGLPTAWVH